MGQPRSPHRPRKPKVKLMTPLEEAILRTVEEVQGCKATELPVRLPRELLGLGYDLTTTIATLVQAGELVEVEYTLPGDPTRIKSFLLPKGAHLLSQEDWS